MIGTVLLVLMGAAIVGVVWAVMHNRQAHPGKLEDQATSWSAKVKGWFK